MPKGTVKSLAKIVLEGEVCSPALAPPQTLTLQTLQETLAHVASKQYDVDSRITRLFGLLEEASTLLFGSEPQTTALRGSDEKETQREGTVAQLNQLASALERAEDEHVRRLDVLEEVVKTIFKRLDIGFGCEDEAK